MGRVSEVKRAEMNLPQKKYRSYPFYRSGLRLIYRQRITVYLGMSLTNESS